MKPMKPSTIEDMEKLRFPLLGSPKLDGFRVRINQGVAMTSNWKPVVNNHVQDVVGAMAVHGIDGEIIVGKPNGPGVLSRTSSGVTTRDGEPDFRIHVFDNFAFADAPFKERLKRAHGLAKQFPRVLVPVKHQSIWSLDDFNIFNAWCLANGYEGAMYRDPEGVYKFGRSTPKEGLLWRYKPFVDSEFEIEGWYEQEANDNEATRDELGRTKRSSHKAGKRGKGVLGGFTGTDIHTGEPVRCGTGFTDEQRAAFWARPFSDFKGRLGKYKRQHASVKDKPRHPVWLDFRDPSDL